jgi:hypothetical protein
LGPVTSLTADWSGYTRDGTQGSGTTGSSPVETQSTNLGVQLTSAAGNSLGLSYGWSSTDYKDQQSVGATSVDNSFRSDQLRLYSRYTYSGLTSLDASYSIVKQSYAQLSTRDTQTSAWRFGANWAMTGQTTLTGQVWNEYSPPTQLTATSTLNRGVSLADRRQITGKLSAYGIVSYEKWIYQTDPSTVLTGAPTRIDTFFNQELKWDYQWYRNGTLSFSFRHANRQSNYPLIGYSYNLWNLSTSAQF